jgi:hypothetical protein
MIPKILIITLTFLITSSAVYSSIPKPILFSENPNAIPVQNFDFVYFPKEIVQAHLPAFEKKRLRLKAENAIKILKLNIPLPVDPAKQIELIDLYKRKQISEKDPRGEKRMELKKELCKLNHNLNLIIPIRRNLISDIQRLKRTIRRDCKINFRLTDKQDAECRAMQEYINFQTTQLAELNQRERFDLQRMRDIRKEINLL